MNPISPDHPGDSPMQLNQASKSAIPVCAPPAPDDSGCDDSSWKGQFPPTLDDRERRLVEDYDWCLTDPEVRKAYGGQVVVVHERKIWGAGKNHPAAWEAARQVPACPPRHDVAFVAVPGGMLASGA